MQIRQDYEQVVKSSSTMETASASIEMTPEMFQILSSGIYQYPEEACVRELSCNALDGQVAAGNADKPFKVHLPNQLEPYFEVRDFGTGMTHEQVMKLYLTYGASTKRDSNDLIGGLGIGSKSPFAVAQSFTVTVYLDGRVRRYSVYMENGKPQVTKLTEGDTSEPNGVAVRVAVPLDKLQIFERVACKIYAHFPVKPDCNKVLTYPYDSMAVLAEEKGVFKIFSGTNNSNTIDTSVVMGNIEYPINLREVIPDMDTVMPRFLQSGIVKALVYLPIGSVSIAASRESLQLNDATKVTIAGIFEKVAKQILSTLQAKVDTATSLFDAIKIFEAAVGQDRNMTHAARLGLEKHITWSGKSIVQWREECGLARRHQMIDPADGKPMVDYQGRPKYDYTTEPVSYTHTYTIRNAGNSGRRMDIWSTNSETEFSLFGNMKPGVVDSSLFILRDRFQKNGAVKTVGNTVILQAIEAEFRQKTGHSDARAWLFDSVAEFEATAKLHLWPRDKIKLIKMSDYEHAYVPKKGVKGQVKLWEAYQGKFQEVKIDLESLDEQQYYIKAESQALVSDTLRKRMELKDLCLLLEKVVPTHRVFMFRKTVWDKIPEDWIEITSDIIADIVKEHPEWYIDMNRHIMVEAAENSRPNLQKMKVKCNMTFANKNRQDGFVDTIRATNIPDPKGVNFEDNLEVFAELFGRVQIIFADIFNRDMLYYPTVLEQLQDVIQKDSKQYKRVEAAKARAKQNWLNERKKNKVKNRLLSWVDWSKVSLREVAEYLGHSMTPYVQK